SSPACCSACGRGTSRVSGLTRCSASTSAAGQPRRSCRRIWTNSKGKRRTPASNYRAERYWVADGFVSGLKKCFAEVRDPRVQGRCEHLLLDILAIAILGVLCGAEDWPDL